MAHRIAILMTTCLLLAACQPPVSSSPQQRFIEVSGEGQVQVTPDVFPVQAEFVRIGKLLPELQAEVDNQIADVLEQLADMGIEENHIQASDLNIRPEWEWQPERRLIGQRVSRTMTVRLHSLDRYTEVLTLLGESNPERVQALGSLIDDPESAHQQALALALETARSRAQALADETGRDLGAVVFIKEQGAAAPPVGIMTMEAAPARQSYTAGEQTVSASILARFELR